MALPCWVLLGYIHHFRRCWRWSFSLTGSHMLVWRRDNKCAEWVRLWEVLWKKGLDKTTPTEEASEKDKPKEVFEGLQMQKAWGKSWPPCPQGTWRQTWGVEGERQELRVQPGPAGPYPTSYLPHSSHQQTWAQVPERRGHGISSLCGTLGKRLLFFPVAQLFLTKLYPQMCMLLWRMRVTLYTDQYQWS